MNAEKCVCCEKLTRSFYDIVEETGIVGTVYACPRCFRRANKTRNWSVLFIYHNREVKPVSRREFIARLAKK
jgi:hypothetical protein